MFVTSSDRLLLGIFQFQKVGEVSEMFWIHPLPLQLVANISECLRPKTRPSEFSCTLHWRARPRLRPRKINVLVLIRKKLKKWWGRTIYIFFFKLKNKCLASRQKKREEKWWGRMKIPYHQKNACISRVSQDWVFDEECGSFFVWGKN